MAEEDFEITSSVPVSELTTCEVLSKTLPGRIGRYILPKDAVIKLTSISSTTANVRNLLDMERSSISCAHRKRMNHVTVESQEESHEDEYESDEEDGFDEDVEEEQEENSADEVSDEEEDGEVQYDWEEDSCQNDDAKKKKQKECRVRNDLY